MTPPPPNHKQQGICFKIDASITHLFKKEGKSVKVKKDDFPNKELGKVAPYGIYDLNHNKGWVSVGLSADCQPLENDRPYQQSRCRYLFSFFYSYRFCLLISIFSTIQNET